MVLPFAFCEEKVAVFDVQGYGFDPDRFWVEKVTQRLVLSIKNPPPAVL